MAKKEHISNQSIEMGSSVISNNGTINNIVYQNQQSGETPNTEHSKEGKKQSENCWRKIKKYGGILASIITLLASIITIIFWFSQQKGRINVGNKIKLEEQIAKGDSLLSSYEREHGPSIYICDEIADWQRKNISVLKKINNDAVQELKEIDDRHTCATGYSNIQKSMRVLKAELINLENKYYEKEHSN